MAVIKPGRVIFEVGGVEPEIAKEALRMAAYKLPVKARVVERKDVGGGKVK